MDSHKGIQRAYSSVITQLRTGKISLASYLYSINQADELECSCGWRRGTVRHVQLECERWSALRTRAWGSRRPEDLKISNKPELAQKVTNLILQTGLLGQFRALRAAPDENPV